GAVESEKHFITECSAYNDIRSRYAINFKTLPLQVLFDEERITGMGDFIIRINKRRSELVNCKES
ncbi:hypothetical protein KI387_042449, partial [Taxus chinensis]